MDGSITYWWFELGLFGFSIPMLEGDETAKNGSKCFIQDFDLEQHFLISQLLLLSGLTQFKGPLEGLKIQRASCNVVGIISPMFGIWLTDLPKSEEGWEGGDRPPPPPPFLRPWFWRRGAKTIKRWLA